MIKILKLKQWPTVWAIEFVRHFPQSVSESASAAAETNNRLHFSYQDLSFQKRTMYIGKGIPTFKNLCKIITEAC